MRCAAFLLIALAALAPGQVRPRREAPPRAVREVERFEQMSPEERRRELDKLPPGRRRLVEERLRRLHSLPPEQRDQLRDRFRRFERLTPERQAALREELRRLRSLPPAQRRRRLQELRGRFSPEEREILQEVSGRPPAR